MKCCKRQRDRQSSEDTDTHCLHHSFNCLRKFTCICYLKLFASCLWNSGGETQTSKNDSNIAPKLDLSVEEGLKGKPKTDFQKKTDYTQSEQHVIVTSESSESDIFFPTLHSLDSYELKSSYGLPVKPFPHRDTTAEVHEHKISRQETPGNMLIF